MATSVSFSVTWSQVYHDEKEYLSGTRGNYKYEICHEEFTLGMCGMEHRKSEWDVR